MLISIIGPSKGGKSTLLKAVLPDFPNVTLLDLDAEENRAVACINAEGGDPDGWEARWDRNFILLQGAEVCPNYVIADVGAGSLQTDQGRLFFVERREQLIAVVAPWWVVWGRHTNRDPEKFRSIEYSDERCFVYNSAKIRIDTSVHLNTSIADFKTAIRSMIENLPKKM
jgi:hypothetical protein